MLRRLQCVLLLAMPALLLACSSPAASLARETAREQQVAGAKPPSRLEFIGQQQVPTGSRVAGSEIGGLSGIDYDPATRTYRAISDDRAEHGPARFYTLELELDRFERDTARPAGMAAVKWLAVTALADADGGAFGPGRVDPEAIRVRDGRLFWSSEGERRPGLLIDPFVREARLDGSPVRSLPLPAHYRTAVEGIGIRRNLAFESLAISNDGRTLYTATESALLQDGPAAAPGARSPSRVLAFDIGSGEPVAEYVYFTDAVIAAPAIVGADNGLVELLHVPGQDRQLLALERGYTPGVGTSIRLYLADLQAATNMLGQSVLDAGAVAIDKTLLLDLGTLGIALDNIEGMTWGPLHNGRPTLVLVADNNFSTRQVTQFLAFEWSSQP